MCEHDDAAEGFIQIPVDVQLSRGGAGPGRERQLQAYNRRNLDEFLACYAADACIRDGRGETLLSGHAEMRARYGAVFERHPELHASVKGRLRAGEWTVDEEQVDEGVPLHLLVAYHVEAGLIRDVVMLRADSI